MIERRKPRAKKTLDSFIDAMIDIAEVAKTDPKK